MNQPTEKRNCPKVVTPATIWITGVSASGKTTMGKYLSDALVSQGVPKVKWLDGEDVRKSLKSKFGYSVKDRTEVIRHMITLANEYNSEGSVVIVSTISHRREVRSWVRSEIDSFMEIFLRCPVDVCAARDFKDNYRRAYDGEYSNFPGVTEPYEESSPELVLDTANCSISECGELLTRHVLDFLHAPTRSADQRDEDVSPRQAPRKVADLPVHFLMTFGHCGIDYLHSQLDSHDQILLMPAFSFYRSWKMIGCDKATSAAEMFALWEEYLRNHQASQVIRRRLFYDNDEAEVFYSKFAELLASSGIEHLDVFYALHDAYCFAKKIDISTKRVLIAHEHVSLAFDQILVDFPQARFIVMNRDPRASLGGSYHQLANDIGHLSDYMFNFNIEIWMQAIRNWKKHGRKLGSDRFRVVLNEDMHADLEKEMREIAEWLGIDYSPVLLKCTFSGREWVGESAYMTSDNKYPQPIDEFYLPENIKKRWMSVLSRRDIAVIELLTGDAMDAFGYQRMTPKNPFWKLYAFVLYLLPHRGLYAYWKKTYPNLDEFESVSRHLGGGLAGKIWKRTPNCLKFVAIFLRSIMLRFKIYFFPGNRRQRYV
ncbi:MAG: adenylyl-sulfate kinase [bacterium]|nr:adenylyl-sulfate kinase [bacterium]